MSAEQTRNTRDVVKLQLGDEIRRITTLQTSGSFDLVCKSVLEVFHAHPESRIELKYKDSEDDLVTIGSSPELKLALDEAKTARRIPKILVHIHFPDRFQQSDVSSQTVEDFDKAMSSVINMLRTAASPAPGSVQGRWRSNGPRGCRGSGKSKHQQ